MTVDWRQRPKRKGYGIDTGSDTLTQQHHAKNQDLNEIVRRFGITGGNIPSAPVDPTYYGDFSDTTDFREALDRVRAAKEHFESLPSALRERFANDPVRLHRFVMAPENHEEAIKLGLLKRRPKPKPLAVERAEELAAWRKGKRPRNSDCQRRRQRRLSKRATVSVAGHISLLVIYVPGDT